jgi:spore germination cell wall hydrolase CwlJ-like protein
LILGTTLLQGNVSAKIIKSNAMSPIESPEDKGDSYAKRNHQKLFEVKIDRKKEVECLTQALYYEARGEGRKGQMAVADVILNRVKSRSFASNICGVVHQRNGRSCQFSFACDNSVKSKVNWSSWNQARQLAEEAITKGTGNVTNNALFFHAAHVSPSWKNMTKTVSIGAHSFYRPLR